MKYKNQIKNILAVAICSIFLAACDKVKLPEAMGDAGQNIVKIVGGGSPANVSKKPVDFLPTPTQILAVSLRRDVANETELNKAMTVTILDDTAAVRAANAAYIQMPAAWYTIQGDGVKTGGQGGLYTVNFKAGEFAKEILITIPNATLFNPSALYGLGFTIQSVTSGTGKISVAKSTVVEVGAKNQYDGIYSVESGLVTRYTAPGVPAGDAISGNLAGNPDVHLITVGSNIVAIPPVSTVGGLYWADAATNNSMVAGIDGVTVTVDQSTNLVTVRSAGNATLANWAGKVNNYVPSTKTFNLAFRWNPTANVREYEVVLKYKKAR